LVEISAKLSDETEPPETPQTETWNELT